MPKFIDLTGEKFNRLAVNNRAPNRGKTTMWNCICDCGNKTAVGASALKNNGVQSCGCLRVEKAKRGTHHLSDTPEYYIWNSMKARCYNKNSADYPRWGGRGIAVCDEWRNSFETFYTDMDPRPTPKHTLDRIDNDGNYGPSNCRWATRTIQNRNKGWKSTIEFHGESLTAAQWSRRLGGNRALVSKRLSRGWAVERALTTSHKLSSK